ncbi:MAG TPA: hypothetical protein VH593_09960, partial [Ktedonobacteraceae bacterium]
RPQQHPQQGVAELGAALKVAGEVARIDIGHAGHERRTKIHPHLPAPERGQQLEAKLIFWFRGSGRGHKAYQYTGTGQIAGKWPPSALI